MSATPAEDPRWRCPHPKAEGPLPRFVECCPLCYVIVTAPDPLRKAARLLAQRGGRTKGKAKSRGDAAYYADLARKAAKARKRRRS